MSPTGTTDRGATPAADSVFALEYSLHLRLEMFAYFRCSLSPRELASRTLKETIADNGSGLAAELAYYFFLSLFPALLFLVALASFFPLLRFADDLIRTAGPFMPAAVVSLLRDQLAKLSEGHDGGLMSLGLLGAIWSSSAALFSVIDVMNRAYDIDESRPWWKVRLMAIGLTICLALFILVSFTLVVAGPEIADFLGRHFGFAPVFGWTWKILQWPIAFALVAIGFGIVYYFAPDAEQEWVWVTPGSLLATTLWLLGSLGFRFYVIHFGDYDEAYGTLGAIILALLWLYLTGFVMIVGAELNAELEHASPWGKKPGEKVPGEKRKIGLAAARAYEHDCTSNADDGADYTLRPLRNP